MRRVATLGVALLVSLPPWVPSAHGESYGTYGLYPFGSARVTAMGGAYTGLSDDVDGILYNPAGLAFSDSIGDLGGNLNHVINQEADLDGDGLNDGIPFDYFSYAGNLKIGSFAFGFGFSSPYFIEYSASDPSLPAQQVIHYELQITSLNFPIAYRLSDQWSVGGLIQSQSIRQALRRTSADPSVSTIDVSTTKSGVLRWLVGISFQPSEKWRFGATYRTNLTFEISESLNDQTDGINWFKSAVIPSKLALGASFKATPRLLFVLDVDWVGVVKDAVYVGSELLGSFNRVEIDSNPKIVVHGGGEWKFFESAWLDLYLRMGLYNEPARIRGGTPRTHGTAGLGSRVGFVTVNGSIDAAADFFNYIISLGLSAEIF